MRFLKKWFGKEQDVGSTKVPILGEGSEKEIVDVLQPVLPSVEKIRGREIHLADLRVLCADDELIGYPHWLEEAGLDPEHIDVITEGDAMREHMKMNQYDLVFMDYTLRADTGGAVLHDIARYAAEKAGYAYPLVVATTAGVDIDLIKGTTPYEVYSAIYVSKTDYETFLSLSNPDNIIHQLLLQHGYTIKQS